MIRTIQKSLSNFSRTVISEIRESFMDAGTVLIFIVAVIVYPMLYSVGYINQTIRDIPVAVIDQDNSSLSRQYTRMLDATEQLSVNSRPVSLKEAEQLFFQGTIHGVVLIPANFEKEILSRRQADVTVYCDAGKFFVYKQVFTASSYATGTLNAGAEIKSLLSQGRSWDDAFNRFEGLNAQFFELYNPSSGYCTFIVPGILIIVIQQSLLVGIGLLFGKNNERRKFTDQGKAIPSVFGNLGSILGKATAYVTLYLGTTLVTLVLLYHWLSFPEKGNYWPVYLLLIPFLYTVSFLGIAIGCWFKKRVHALMFIVFASPMVFFLTGVAWPVESLPPLLKLLAFAFPTTPMIPAFIKLRLIGGGINSVFHEWTVLMVQLLVYLILALVSYRFAMKSNNKPVKAEAI
ncbi:MAG: ABC transporter permease [Bacteroidota bacterium]